MYLPSDRWFQGDPDDQHTGRPFWVSVRRLRDNSDFVELLTWFGPTGRWGSPYDTDRLHFRVTGYMRADIPPAYFL